MPSDCLNWTEYVYGSLAHSYHIKYDESSEQKGEASVRRGLERMGVQPEYLAGRKVLDVGTGLYALGFHRVGAIVEHRDISKRTVHALNTYADGRGYHNLKSLRTDLVSGQIPDEHFDLIYLSGVFQHFEEPSRALANLCGALKCGGYLYIDIYRSGRWRWFVIDVLRKIADRSLLYDVLSRFTDYCALGETRGFHLRQVELIIDDIFVEHAHLFHPEDVQPDAEALGLTLVKPVTSMDRIDGLETVDHSLFYAHVFNTLVFQKTTATDTANTHARTKAGRDQLGQLEGMSGSYRDVANLTAEFVLAHRAGRFSRDALISHIVNLYRMAHPCLSGDPYLEIGKREPADSVSVAGDEQTLARRHSLWCSFLANILNIPNPLDKVELDSLGYELIRFVSSSGYDTGITSLCAESSV
jgi:SAM-dependent methyltransferase